MEFDEYEYLEKTVENPEPSAKEKATENGIGGAREDRDRVKASKSRRDDSGRDSDRHSKRVKLEGDGARDRDRDRGRDRQSSRHHALSPDRLERDGERDREKHRSRKEHLDRDTDRVRNGKERDMEREKEMGMSRRSRSRSERHNEEERHMRVESREGEYKERERPMEFRDRDTRRYKQKKEDGAEPEVDPERDQRTVFAYQIGLKADERHVYEFFSKAGKVRDVRLIMDRNSRRSKGVGYIEFYDAMSVPMAIALSGQLLLGQPVMVKPSEAEKNLVQSTTTAGAVGGASGSYSGGARRLYVGNLHYNITEDQLRQVFEPFGTVELVQLPLDSETGCCKGYGFIQFARLEDARAAQSLNGQIDIAGKTIKVSAVTDQVGMQDVGANAGDFDDDDGGGLALNARSRAMLMQKLDRSGTATSALAASAITTPGLTVTATPALGISPLVAPLVPLSLTPLVGLPLSGLPAVPAITPTVETIGTPSECLLLKNMFDPKMETEPGFELDIKEDVQEECSKFGTVKHIFVEKNSAGFVYLRLDAVTSAVNAQRALHGRWFAGKMITATFLHPQNYDAKFPGNS